mmetsp:Transcript_16860/g.34334  ORF Transcript_16860/g.34334 Transcript_16860/m.34334 type:complete len:155 (-) Transcript_16860:424-888(-)|eukprot:CAMPEP_0171615718 /NCGR_PEP_ID=MMETSP0990-20121206/13048_1 /TAXON_ID=483369 /ORGANISM="non described non described, Strain CCMP2098" /LENGTH=154 /DNA_ID=CAMNT_0012179845 /DNA_START=53 /DNA_END=517 /DNA_ORIENTATION=-
MSESKVAEAKDVAEEKEDKGAQSPGDDIYEKVSEFCMSSGFQRDFERFAEKHAATFDSACDMKAGDEHSLQFHSIYEEYLATFEGKIEEFVRSEGSSVDEFQRLAAAALRDPDTPFERMFFIEALLATTEYETFLGLMKNEARRVRALGPSDAK